MIICRECLKELSNDDIGLTERKIVITKDGKNNFEEVYTCKECYKSLLKEMENADEKKLMDIWERIFKKRFLESLNNE